MHLILSKNADIFDQSFFESTQEWGERFPVQRWTQVWQMYYPYSNVISFYYDFVYPILKMIGCIIERVPRNVRKVFRPKWCFDAGKQLTHDWGSVFLFEEYIIIRIFGCPHPPHIVPKYVPERLGLVEIFWQLISLNREYLGKGVKK